MPLEGIRVVEFASLIAGPFCGLTLADLGADVVKVEPPAGDESRRFPPFGENGESGFFHALNRGKRGAVLEHGDERLLRLVREADVVIENLGSARERIGFGSGELPERQVWCSVSGLGADRSERAMDPTLQASMGLMALTGERDGPPLRVPVPLIDFMTGMYAAQSVLVALWRAERTGRGAHLDCALLDSTATLTGAAALLALSGQLNPHRIGSESFLRVPSASFEASDGRHVQIVALHERHWQALCRAFGREDWLDDPRCADNDARLADRDHVHGLIREVVAGEPAAAWVERINAAGGLCEEVRELAEAWQDPLLAERGLVGRLAGDAIDFPLPVMSLAGMADPQSLRPGPRLGEHTEEVLAELS